MPTYEYNCEDCNKKYDVVQKMIDPPLKYCPKCGSEKINKCISLPMIMTSKTVIFSPFKSGEPGVVIDSVPPDFRHPKLRARRCITVDDK